MIGSGILYTDVRVGMEFKISGGGSFKVISIETKLSGSSINITYVNNDGIEWNTGFSNWDDVFTFSKLVNREPVKIKIGDLV